MRKSKLLFHIIILILNQTLFSQVNVVNRIDSLVLSLYNTNQFSGQVLVGNKDSIIYKRAFGYANKQENKINQTKTPTHLASISKSITAMAVMKLYQEGKIDIHKSIKIYLKEIPFDDITIHQVLSHTSGITDINNMTYWRKLDRFSTKYYGDLTNEGLMKFFELKKTKREFQPGEKYMYNNTGYSVLASLIERVSGIKYDDYLRLNIFEPLGMDSSFVFDYNTLKKHSIAFSYSYSKKAIKRDESYYEKKNGELKPYTILKGDKHILSCAEDMYKLDTSFINNRYLSNALKQQMLTPVKLNNGQVNEDSYGYGWFCPGPYAAFHTGSIEHYSTMNFIYDSDAIVIILANKEMDIYSLMDNLLNILYDRELGQKPLNKIDVESKNKFEKTFKVDYKPLSNNLYK